MRKGAKTILGIALGLLVLISLATIAAGQKPGKKPPSEEVVWGVRIPAYGNLSGQDGGSHLYTDADSNVRVSIGESTTGTTVDYTSIRLFIFANASNDTNGDPLETFVSFYNVTFPELVQADDPGPTLYCGFPPAYNTGSPDCLRFFLNSNHPKRGYEHVLFSFRIDADLEDEMLFPKGSRIKYTGPGAITIYIWNSFEALTVADPYPYHTVTLHLANLCSDGDKGYYITRINDSEWELNLEDQVLDIRQSYSWEEVTGIGKNKRPIITRTSYVPHEGLINLSYRFVIVKNPK